MAKQDDWIRITLRLPSDLHSKLSDAAENSSMNAEIVERLTDSFHRRLSKNSAALLLDEIRELVLGHQIHDLLDDHIGQALMNFTVENGITDTAALHRLLAQALKANGYIDDDDP